MKQILKENFETKEKQVLMKNFGKNVDIFFSTTNFLLGYLKEHVSYVRLRT